jgi:hypothetical protein
MLGEEYHQLGQVAKRRVAVVLSVVQLSSICFFHPQSRLHPVSLASDLCPLPTTSPPVVSLCICLPRPPHGCWFPPLHPQPELRFKRFG